MQLNIIIIIIIIMVTNIIPASPCLSNMLLICSLVMEASRSGTLAACLGNSPQSQVALLSWRICCCFSSKCWRSTSVSLLGEGGRVGTGLWKWQWNIDNRSIKVNQEQVQYRTRANRRGHSVSQHTQFLKNNMIAENDFYETLIQSIRPTLTFCSLRTPKN